ncbi:hypothetical protein CICLE_v10023150mg [Citrus x clementina]|uniref:Secreted protein n=2 Tax=Citrus TaxID=2706 RepID=A0A067DTX8_CITSI|nr:hypothetical protein CICLE_v10023150mg [Citrus x clementina]KDO46263.1 hypothetical protein CISIN_1g038198mg [Citrus sinensis]
MSLLSLARAWNCLLCLKLLTAETMTTKSTANITLPPQNQPSLKPSCLRKRLVETKHQQSVYVCVSVFFFFSHHMTAFN